MKQRTAGRPEVRPPYIKKVDDITPAHEKYFITKLWNMYNDEPSRWRTVSASDMTTYLKVCNAVVKNEILERLIHRGQMERSFTEELGKSRVNRTTHYGLMQEVIDGYRSK